MRGPGLAASQVVTLAAENGLADPVRSKEFGVVTVQGGAEPPVKPLPRGRPGKEEHQESGRGQAESGANGNLG